MEEDVSPTEGVPPVEEVPPMDNVPPVEEIPAFRCPICQGIYFKKEQAEKCRAQLYPHPQKYKVGDYFFSPPRIPGYPNKHLLIVEILYAPHGHKPLYRCDQWISDTIDPIPVNPRTKTYKAKDVGEKLLLYIKVKVPDEDHH